jgi:hypothetical protein
VYPIRFVSRGERALAQSLFMAKASLSRTSSFTRTSTKATVVEYPSTALHGAVYENSDPRDTALRTSQTTPNLPSTPSKEIATPSTVSPSQALLKDNLNFTTAPLCSSIPTSRN